MDMQFPDDIKNFEAKHYKLFLENIYNERTMVSPIILSIDKNSTDFKEIVPSDYNHYEIKYAGIKNKKLEKSETYNYWHIVIPDFRKVDEEFKNNKYFHEFLNVFFKDNNKIHTYSHIDYIEYCKLSIINKQCNFTDDIDSDRKLKSLKCENILLNLKNIIDNISEYLFYIKNKYDIFGLMKHIIYGYFRITPWSTCNISYNNIILHYVAFKCKISDSIYYNYINIIYNRYGNKIDLMETSYYYNVRKFDELCIYYICGFNYDFYRLPDYIYQKKDGKYKGNNEEQYDKIKIEIHNYVAPTIVLPSIIL